MNELLIVGSASFLIGLGLGLLYHAVYLMRKPRRHANIEGRRHTKRYLEIQKKYAKQEEKLQKVLDKYEINSL